MHLRYVRRADPRSEAEARSDCKRPVVCWWMEGTYNSRMNWLTECAHIETAVVGAGATPHVPYIYYEPCPGVMVYTVHSSTQKREIKRVTTAHSVRCATVMREGGAAGGGPSEVRPRTTRACAPCSFAHKIASWG